MRLPKTHAEKERRLVEQHFEPERSDGLAESDQFEAGLVIVDSCELVGLTLAACGVRQVT